MSHAAGTRRPKAILIAGPTASGKSALALRLAKRLGGRIINADSMQVYRDLRILTARPTEAEVDQVPHRLYGTVDGAETYSVSRWLADARTELALALADDAVPIIVGGSGLYFKALTQGLSDIPAVPGQIRDDIRRWAMGRPVEALHAELADRDPIMAARLRPTDPQRILRAIEVHAATGKSLATYQDRRGSPAIDLAETSAMTLQVERTDLAVRIAQRVRGMFEPAALAEVSSIVFRRLDAALPIMRAIGVPQAVGYLSGRTTIEAAFDETALASRQYVKRQETFFRHQLPDFRSIAAEAAEPMLLETAQS